MKKDLKVFALVFGVIIAIVALSNTQTYADNNEHAELKEMVALEVGTLEKIEQMLQLPEAEECEKRIKIFNSDNELIYECRDDDDQRLKLLLRRSDLMLQTDSSSYYLLGD
jgi:hypothetical protein